MPVQQVSVGEMPHVRFGRCAGSLRIEPGETGIFISDGRIDQDARNTLERHNSASAAQRIDQFVEQCSITRIDIPRFRRAVSPDLRRIGQVAAVVPVDDEDRQRRQDGRHDRQFHECQAKTPEKAYQRDETSPIDRTAVRLYPHRLFPAPR